MESFERYLTASKDHRAELEAHNENILESRDQLARINDDTKRLEIMMKQIINKAAEGSEMPTVARAPVLVAPTPQPIEFQASTALPDPIFTPELTPLAKARALQIRVWEMEDAQAKEQKNTQACMTLEGRLLGMQNGRTSVIKRITAMIYGRDDPEEIRREQIKVTMHGIAVAKRRIREAQIVTRDPERKRDFEAWYANPELAQLVESNRTPTPDEMAAKLRRQDVQGRRGTPLTHAITPKAPTVDVLVEYSASLAMEPKNPNFY